MTCVKDLEEMPQVVLDILAQLLERDQAMEGEQAFATPALDGGLPMSASSSEAPSEEAETHQQYYAYQQNLLLLPPPCVAAAAKGRTAPETDADSGEWPLAGDFK